MMKVFFVLGVGFFVSALMVGFLLGLFCINYMMSNNMRSSSKFMIGCSIFACGMYILCGICNGLYCLYRDSILITEFIGLLCYYLEIIFWNFGQLFGYMYLLYRLYRGFTGTAFAVSYLTFIVMVSLMIGYFCFIGIIGYSLVTFIIRDEGVSYLESQFEYYLTIIWKGGTLGFDLILSVSLLVIFVVKMYNVTESLHTIPIFEMDDVSNPSSQRTDISNLEIQKNNIYKVVTKVTILGVILIISSQITLILSLISWIESEYGQETPLKNIYDSIKIIQIFIASLCLILGFEFTNKWYHCLCYKCHYNIKQYCVKKIENSLDTNKEYTLMKPE